MTSTASDHPPLVIVGSGGHGREVLDVARHAIDGARQVVGVLSDTQPEGPELEVMGTSWLGPVSRIGDLAAEYVVAVGDPAARRQLSKIAESSGLGAAILWHRSAHRGTGTSCAPGTVVLPGAIISTFVRMGRHVHVNLGATVAHDCVLGDFVTVNPGANVNGNVTIDDGATVGSGAVIKQGVTIGRLATIGAGAVVLGDVEPGTTVVGVPARPISCR